jgi:hypothetical protein
MAYTAPSTASVGGAVTAALWNSDVRDNVADHETYVSGIRTGWQGFAPVLKQSTTTVSTSSSFARYIKIGKLVNVYFELVCSSNGVSGTSISLTLPVAAAYSLNAFTSIGSMSLYDASSTNVYPGLCVLDGTSAVRFTTTKSIALNSQQYLGFVDFTAALANGDYVAGSYMYEAA